jgi:hypothetical protein
VGGRRNGGGFDWLDCKKLEIISHELSTRIYSESLVLIVRSFWQTRDWLDSQAAIEFPSGDPRIGRYVVSFASSYA